MIEQGTGIKKTKKRSASYPAFNLEQAVEATRQLKDKLGDGPYSREHMAVALGYKGVTGSSGMKIAACVNFGLLDRTGNTYSQSDLARKLFHYIDNEEREATLIEAFGHPSLYQKLIAEYSGKSLPGMLESILVRNYGIQENAAKGAVTNFKESAEFVGALKNGVLNLNGISDSLATDIPGISQPIAPVPITPALRNDTMVQHIQGRPVLNSTYLSVNLPSGIVMSYPQELAPAFAFGMFAQPLRALDDAIAGFKASQDSTTADDLGEVDEA